MGQGARLIFFLIVAALCAAAIVFWPSNIQVSPAIKVILFASLVTAAFSGTLIEHFFTKPRDVVANATAALLLLLPAYDDLGKLGWIYFAIISFYIFLIAAASTAILIYSMEPNYESSAAKFSRFLHAIATKFGSFKVIYGLSFLAVTFFYVDTQSTIFVVLMLYYALVLAVEPGDIIGKLKLSFAKDDIAAVGDVIGVQSRNVFLAKLRPQRTSLKRFGQVTFRYKFDGKSRACVIADNYLLNEEQWVKLVPISDVEDDDASRISNVVYSGHGEQTANQIVDRILGMVVHGSTIGRVKFEYASRNAVSQGKLIEIQIGEQRVLYQIVQGLVVEEILEHKNKSGSITGEAVQLGVWNPEKRRFERYGWVPEINSLILEPSPAELSSIGDGELQLGSIPGTVYPLLMNVDDAITHHLAIFGVTGSGKSVFTRWLLQRYLEDDVLVLCIDNTQEYQKKLPPNSWSPVVPAAENDEIRKRINFISTQMDKWPRERDAKKLQSAQDEIDAFFAAAIGALPQGRIGILNVPDLESTVEGLEYIRLFFSAVFGKARAGTFGERRVCIVLEEAHTLVPEWNFNSGDEKRTHALVNTIAQIALQGRKYNVGLVVIGQRTANVSKTVLTQCNSVIAFQQFDPTGLDFFSHYMGEDFAQGLSVLPSRRAVAVGKAFAAGVPLIFQVPEIDELPAPGNINLPVGVMDAELGDVVSGPATQGEF